MIWFIITKRRNSGELGGQRGIWKPKIEQKWKIDITLVQALNDLIMGQFEEGGIDAFRKWSGEIHAQVIETLPLGAVNKQVTEYQQEQLTSVKILKWDVG